MFERLEQMDKRTIVRLAIAAIVGILIFGAITNGIRQAGWNDGGLVLGLCRFNSQKERFVIVIRPVAIQVANDVSSLVEDLGLKEIFKIDGGAHIASSPDPFESRRAICK